MKAIIRTTLVASIHDYDSATGILPLRHLPIFDNFEPVLPVVHRWFGAFVMSRTKASSGKFTSTTVGTSYVQHAALEETSISMT